MIVFISAIQHYNESYNKIRKKISKYWQQIRKMTYVYSDNFFLIPGESTNKLLEIVTEPNNVTRNKINRQNLQP